MPKVSLNNQLVKNRRQLLYERYGGYMTLPNVMRELGVSRNTAIKFVATLPVYCPTGRRVYDIEDVAKKLESTRTPPRGIR